MNCGCRESRTRRDSFFFLTTGGRSSNGRTPDSESGYSGSNPDLPTKISLKFPQIVQLVICDAGSSGLRKKQIPKHVRILNGFRNDKFLDFSVDYEICTLVSVKRQVKNKF